MKFHDPPPRRGPLAEAVEEYARTTPGPPEDLVLFVSRAGDQFVHPAGTPAPAGVRRAAEFSLLAGRSASIVSGGRRWIAFALDEPLVSLVAVGAPAGRGEAAESALIGLRALLADEVLPAELAADPFLALSGACPSLSLQFDSLRRIAQTRLSVLLLGETGVGKEEIARAIHRASGRPGAFVAENCAALPETLLEAELFGVRRGAFTGAGGDRRGRILEADAGTLLLDEIGDLSAPLQAKLLRVLQEREVRALGADRPRAVDLRVVAATHQPLDQLLEDGRFRRDLYYRVAGAIVRTPPLRERISDLPELIATLLARLAREGVGPGRRVTVAGLAALARWKFDGNVRELDNILRRAAALSPGPVIPGELLAPVDPRRLPAAANLETQLILDALSMSGGSKAEAARRLGWTRQKLYRRIVALGLPSGPNCCASSASSTSRVSSAG